jgi:hypothetical protein
MSRIPPLLAGCLLTAGFAITTAGTWIYVTGRMGPAAIAVCALACALASLAVEAAIREIGRIKRVPLIRRWTTTRHRKPRLPGGAP